MVSQSSISSESGSRKVSKRLGRGNASGKGTFSGRGCNGQNARSGGGVHALFEGGQTALHMRTPKLKGFKKHNHKTYSVVNLDDVSKLVEAGEKKIDRSVLVSNGLIREQKGFVKLLAFGTLPKELSVEIHVDKVSAQAKKSIEAAGGTVVVSE